MGTRLISSEKLVMKSSQDLFFNLPKKQTILAEYIEEEKRAISSVIRVINEEFRKVAK